MSKHVPYKPTKLERSIVAGELKEYVTRWDGNAVLDPGKILIKTSGAPFESISLARALTIPNSAIFTCECGTSRMYGYAPVENRHPMIYCHRCREHTTHDFHACGLDVRACDVR